TSLPKLLVTTYVVRMTSSSDRSSPVTQDTSEACPVTTGSPHARARLPSHLRWVRRAAGAARARFADVGVVRRLARPTAGPVGGIHAEHAPATGRGRRAALDLLHRAHAATAALAVPDR